MNPECECVESVLLSGDKTKDVTNELKRGIFPNKHSLIYYREGDWIVLNDSEKDMMKTYIYLKHVRP